MRFTFSKVRTSRQGVSSQAQTEAMSKSHTEFNGKIKTRASKAIYLYKEMSFCEATCTLQDTHLEDVYMLSEC